jgi:hypothetical protein
MHRLLTVFTAMTCLAGWAQTSPPSGGKFGPQWRLLAGEWMSEAAAGGGAGSSSFRFELGGHILVRTNHVEGVPTGKPSGGAHNDLMVIYPGANESQAHATYWDNEGHVIEYSASWSADGNTLTFLSKPGAGPQFRLTYKKLDADSLSVSFDMAAPGQGGVFKPYISGRIRRQK